MRKSIIIVVALGVAFFLLSKLWFSGDASSRLAAQAVARGDLRFVTIISSDGIRTLPQVPGIPAWYFERAGTKGLGVPPKAMTADTLRDLHAYKEALFREIKAQGRMQVLEQDIARVRTEIENEGPLQKTNQPGK
jgi:hypothetical protein